LTRFVDRGAVVAGWIGAGMALVLVIALGLVIPIQPLVALMALPAGALIGAYANVRAQRHWPRMRVLGNALWAGAVTGLALAVLYVGVRLLFVYLDTGTLPDGSRLDCQRGPDCVYQRLIEAGYAEQLAAVGVTDAAGYEQVMLAELAGSGLLMFSLTIGGAALGGATQTMTGWARRERQEEASAA
jgi:hypothetical protein